MRFPIRLKSRHGVSLLEVMFSIGVAFMGLLGVAALMPLAAHFMRSGVTADNASAFGRSSISELDIRGIPRRDNWAIWDDVNNNRFIAFDADPRVTQPAIDTVTDPNVWRAASFCVDPLLISRVYQESLPSGNPVAPNLFPAVGITQAAMEARMARVTLRILPGRALNSLPFEMLPATAEALFRFDDDLVFTLPGRDPGLPKDTTMPPEQEYSVDTTNPNLKQKRHYAGDLYWMATFTPMVRQTGGFVTQDNYLMSVVVFNKRNTNLNSEPERVVDVVWFWGGGIGGGDIQITPRTYANPPGTDEDLEVRTGDWVMLSGRLPADQVTGAPGASVFRWYRVVSSDPESQFATSGDPNNPGPMWLRDISLHGADWNPGFFVRTQATIVSGVVAVFEKTVRLEGSSLWTSNY